HLRLLGALPRRSRVEVLSFQVLQDLALLEGTVGLAPEDEQVAGPVGAAEDVVVAVAVQVHSLWTEPDASARGDLGDFAAGHEPGVVRESGRLVGADVLVDPELPLAELSDEQVALAVAVEIVEQGMGVT